MFTVRLLGFNIEIQLTFLILAIFVLGAFSGAGVALWIAAAFVSVVIHELGHAVTARAFGGIVDGITIHAMGGVTVWRAPMAMGGFRRFIIAAAGSGSGLILAGVLFALVRTGTFGDLAQRAIITPWRVALVELDRIGEYAVFFLGAFIWISIVWGLVNWLPIGGLDGSRMLRELLVKFLGPRGAFHAAVIGIIAAVIAAVWLFNRGSVFVPLILLLFAFNDFNRVRAGGG